MTFSPAKVGAEDDLLRKGEEWVRMRRERNKRIQSKSYSGDSCCHGFESDSARKGHSGTGAKSASNQVTKSSLQDCA